MKKRVSIQQEEHEQKIRTLLTEALLLLSEEMKQRAMEVKNGTLSLVDVEEALMQTMQECLGHLI